MTDEPKPDSRTYIGDFFGVPIYVVSDFDPWGDFTFEHNGRRTTFRILPDGSMVIIDDEEIED